MREVWRKNVRQVVWNKGTYQRQNHAVIHASEKKSGLGLCESLPGVLELGAGLELKMTTTVTTTV